MRWLLACVLLTASYSALAEGRFYGEVQVGGAIVTHSDLEFFPGFASISAGAFVYPGIGVEVFADRGFRSGEDDDFDLDIDSAFGVGIRFQSPPQRGVQGFIVLGAVEYSLEQDSPSSPRVEGDFTGARVSVGLMQRLVLFPNILFTAEYRHYNADEPLKIDGLLFGFRFNTP